MTINELQKQLHQQDAHLTIQFHDVNNIYTNLQQFGLYTIIVWLNNSTDSLGSKLFAFISTINSNYKATTYKCKNKSALIKIIKNFINTAIQNRRYNTYKSNNIKSTIQGKQFLQRTLEFQQSLEHYKLFKQDLEDIGKIKWDILDTSKDNFDDYEDFRNPSPTKKSKTITLTLPPREIDYLKWVRKCCNKKNNNDEDFGRTDKDTIQALLSNDATIDWDKYHRVMQNEAQYELSHNGQLADLTKIINNKR